MLANVCCNYKTLLEGDYSLPEFEHLANNEWAFTEKVNGTSIRLLLEHGEIRIGGRTENAPLLTRLHQLLMPRLDRLREQFPERVCFSGEGYGPQIQNGGGNYSDRQDFVLFAFLGA